FRFGKGKLSFLGRYVINPELHAHAHDLAAAETSIMTRHYLLSNPSAIVLSTRAVGVPMPQIAFSRTETTSSILYSLAIMTSSTARPGSESRARADLMRIYASAVAAVAPARVTAAAFEGSLPETSSLPAIIAAAEQVRMLAVGKAALGMAREASAR